MGRRLCRRRGLLQRSVRQELNGSARLASAAELRWGPGRAEGPRVGSAEVVLWCGQVGVNHRRDNHRQEFARVCVRSARELSRRIVPFFEDNPLFTAKRRDFESFAGVVRLMCDCAHLLERGPAEIAAIVATINHRKSSRSLESSEAIRQPPRPTSR